MVASAASKSQSDPPHELDAAALFRAHATWVAGFLFRLGVAAADIDDVVQEVFVIAHRRGGWVRGPAKPTTWLGEIAVRVAATQRRSRRRRSALEQGPGGRGVSDRAVVGPDRAHEDRRALEQVQAAIDALDEQKQVVFVLFELEGESCEAIAGTLGVPVGTVYSRLHAARRQFQRVLADLAGGEVVGAAARVETA